jgi:hypothetical protein
MPVPWQPNYLNFRLCRAHANHFVQRPSRTHCNPGWRSGEQTFPRKRISIIFLDIINKMLIYKINYSTTAAPSRVVGL